MLNKLAKLKYLANNFEIIEEGDHVVCAISQKKYQLKIYHIGMLKNKRLIIHSLKHPSKEIY